MKTGTTRTAEVGPEVSAGKGRQQALLLKLLVVIRVAAAAVETVSAYVKARYRQVLLTMVVRMVQ
jgi:hypothetical protein